MRLKYLICLLFVLYSCDSQNFITKKYPVNLFADYYITFDTNKISEAEMDRLIFFNPDYSLSYSTSVFGIAMRQVELEYSDRINIIKMSFNDPLLIEVYGKVIRKEQEIIIELASWEKFNLQKLAVEYLKEMNARYWLDKLKYDYFRTNDTKMLKATYQNINTEELASEIIKKIEMEKDPSKRFDLLKYDFYNRINHYLPRRSDDNYITLLWNNFITEYQIRERIDYQTP